MTRKIITQVAMDGNVFSGNELVARLVDLLNLTA